MTVRAKLHLTAITDSVWNRRTLRFDTHYDDMIPEDMRFQMATPTGHAELQIDNPAALEQFKLGESYYVDFVPVPKPQV
jgi:hypothetical protein